MSDNYHHGNLRRALIDAGVRIINEEGEDKLSLRKVAAACEVSHAAPYAHFKDKEELLAAIKSDVTERFMGELEKDMEKAESAEQAILLMGKTYVSFFSNNPDYFKFLFASQKLVAHLRMDKEYPDDYPPFLLLKNTYKKYLSEKNINMDYKEQEAGLLKIWASVHGLSAIACMAGVETSIDWNHIELN